MSNLTASTIHKTAPRSGRSSYVIKNAVVLFAGALVGTDANGFLDKWADTAGLKFEGICLSPATGDTSASPNVETRVDISGTLLKGVAVASLTQADVNSLVYCASDNPADFSLSASTNVKAVGRVMRFISSGVGDVQLFTPMEHMALN